jgi:hypothetical protein
MYWVVLLLPPYDTGNAIYIYPALLPKPMVGLVSFVGVR